MYIDDCLREHSFIVNWSLSIKYVRFAFVSGSNYDKFHFLSLDSLQNNRRITIALTFLQVIQYCYSLKLASAVAASDPY